MGRVSRFLDHQTGPHLLSTFSRSITTSRRRRGSSNGSRTRSAANGTPVQSTRSSLPCRREHPLLEHPLLKFPPMGLLNQAINLTLKWEGGPWGQKYDIYFGTTSNPPLLAKDAVTGAPEDPSGPLTLETFNVSGLAHAKKYFWRIVSKTAANLTTGGPTWSFTTQ